MNQNTPHIVIVGLGLLGSSLAAALRESGLKIRLTGVSSPATTKRALAEKLVDQACDYPDIVQWKNDADLVFLCTPVSHLMNYMNEIVACPVDFRQGAVISDVGSTKEIICRHGEKLFAKSRADFVGGHPMAGSEKRGLDAQDATLFQSAYWILCPSKGEVPPLLLNTIHSTGAHTLQLDAAQHDQRVAAVSHLPQLLASTLAASMEGEEVAQALAGRAYRDMTRIASSSFSVWKDIFSSNHIALRNSLEKFSEKLEKVRVAVNKLPDEFDELEKLFSIGAGIRAKLPPRGKGFRHELVELIVTLPDRPGAITALTEPLGREGINIRDIELLKVREGEDGEGTMLLGFDSREEAERAVELLTGDGIPCRMRP